jgi:hypothetical protein
MGFAHQGVRFLRTRLLFFFLLAFAGTANRANAEFSLPGGMTFQNFQCRRFLKNPQLQWLKFDDGYLYGETFDLTDALETKSGQVMLYRDLDGKFQLFDESTGEFPRRFDERPEGLSDLKMSTRGEGKAAQVRTRKILCGLLREARMDPDFSRDRVEFLHALRKIARTEKRMTSSCLISMASFFASFYGPYLYQVGFRAKGHHGFWEDHGDNFYMTLPLIASFENCIVGKGGLGGKIAKNRFYIALSAGVLANVLEEVDIGGKPIFTTPGNRGTRSSTDWADLGAGGAAVGLYAIFNASSDRMLRFNFDRECRP